MPKLEKLHVRSIRTTWFQKMGKKHEISKHAIDLRGLGLIHNNASAHKCKAVHDFLEAETVVQLHNPSYSLALSPCDFSCLLYKIATGFI